MESVAATLDTVCSHYSGVTRVWRPLGGRGNEVHPTPKSSRASDANSLIFTARNMAAGKYSALYAVVVCLCV